jgi:hypothetical protein
VNYCLDYVARVKKEDLQAFLKHFDCGSYWRAKEELNSNCNNRVRLSYAFNVRGSYGYTVNCKVSST